MRAKLSLHLFVEPLSRTVQFHGDTLTSTVLIQFAPLGIDRKAHDNHVIVVQLSLSHFPTDLRPKLEDEAFNCFVCLIVFEALEFNLKA